MAHTQADSYPRLVGDIGGTNARFGWLPEPGAAVTDIATLKAADHASLTDAVRRYLDEQGKQPPRWCAIGIANPVIGDHVQIVESRPMSRDKRWVVENVIKKEIRTADTGVADLKNEVLTEETQDTEETEVKAEE